MNLIDGGDMFLNKTKERMEKNYKYLRDLISGLERKVDYNDAMTVPPPDLVTCEKCGCAVFRDKAYKGKSVVGSVPLYRYLHGIEFGLGERREVIEETFYCKKHRKLAQESE